MNIDPIAIREHVEMLHTLAGGIDGQLVVASYGQNPTTGAEILSKVRRFDVGEVEPMIEEIIRLTQERHRNVYVPLHVVRKGLNGHQRGGKNDIVAMLGLVIDFDDDRAGDYAERQPLPADMVLETSEGNYQSFYLFSQPIDPGAADLIAKDLKKYCSGSDHCTSNIDQPFRVPETLNWPNKKKADAGRSLDPQIVEAVEGWGGTMTTAEDLARAIKPPTEDVQADQPEPPKTGTDDAGLIERASKALNGAKFSRLYAGDWSGYDSRSAADQALCNMLAFWTGKDSGRMDRLFRSSGLMREKWDVVHASDGRTYGAMTISTAINSCGEVYTERNQPPGNTDKAKFEAAPAINDDEWEHSELAPPCIVDKYLYVDLGQQSGPGGLGKTTFSLFEAIHIVLGMPLFGLEIRKPGPVVMLTAEDRRPLLIARLRRIAESMNLSRTQVAEVCRSVRIHDVTCDGYRLSQAIGDTIIPTPFIDEIIDAYTSLEPSLMVMDPLASFGIGEDNNAMQAMVEAGRRIVRGLGACLRYTHHVGQEASRAFIKDQFAGRGGTALPNGCRIIHILQPMNAKEWMERTGEPLAPNENAISLSRPKLSYCPPQDEIFIRRSGYRFESLERTPDDPTARVKRDAATILDFLLKQYIAGERMTQNALFSSELGIAQKGIRDAVTRLLDNGEVIVKKIEPPPQRGAKEFLFPIAAYPNCESQEH